jgi:hypothetical protein
VNESGILVLMGLGGQELLIALFVVLFFAAQMQLFSIAGTLKKISRQLPAVPDEPQTLRSTKIEPRTLLLVGLGIVACIVIVALTVSK